MSTLIYQASWRPLRLGWCVRKNDHDALIKIFRINHCLWGGRYNPVIVIDDAAAARRMIDLYNVDVMVALPGDERCQAFTKTAKHLPSPFFHGTIFEDRGSYQTCEVLDIYHPVRNFYDDHVKGKEAPNAETHLYRWENDDRLAAAFEASLGRYPDRSGNEFDYATLVSQFAAGKEVVIANDGALDGGIISALTPSALSGRGLERERTHGLERHEPGIFVGDPTSFSHLVDFWNLRAADVELFFFDLATPERMKGLVESFGKWMSSLQPHPMMGEPCLGLWLGRGVNESDLPEFSVATSSRAVEEPTWDDRVWRGLLVTPPVMHFSEHTIVAQVSPGERAPMVTLQVGEKPGFDEPRVSGQHAVLSLQTKLHYSRDENFFFNVPFIPELNEFYGRNHHLGWNEARASRNGFGIILPLFSDHLTLYGMDRIAFAKRLFLEFGIESEISNPGRICDQLIRQMGGIQGCRVFKIGGVRRLIDRYSPDQSFTRSAALQMILGRNETTGVNDFDFHKDLFLEASDKPNLRPSDAFDFLLKREVFRVGLKPRCPSCRLEFWHPLDGVKAHLTCEYCGRDFNVTPQLRDRDWAYRRSGLFGRNDHQGGGIPVALTLQQLHTSLHSSNFLWLPAMTLAPKGAAIESCETDFVIVHQDWHGRVELVIGECKANQDITDADVRHLAAVAAAFPPERFDVYVVFSKTGEFSTEEIARCRAGDDPQRPRTILLSARQLEPYDIYEHDQEYGNSLHGSRLSDMVDATRQIFYSRLPVGLDSLP